jgi:hypothetical protein
MSDPVNPNSASEKLKKSQFEMARVGGFLHSTEDGKLLLDILRDMYYDGDIVADNPHETYRKLGQRDVVKFLLGLRDRAHKEK